MKPQSPSPAPGIVGIALIRASWLGTALFVVSSALSVVLDVMRPVGVAVSLGLFAVGCAVFLWAFAIGVDRSRVEDVHVPGLFFLTGTAPARTKRLLLGSVAAQTVIAVVAASIRPFTTVAFGILVPMYGLGVTGLWAARHGVFETRTDIRPKRKKAVRDP